MGAKVLRTLRSPTSLLHAGQIARQRIHAELELRTQTSSAQVLFLPSISHRTAPAGTAPAENVVARTYPSHPKRPKHTPRNPTHLTPIIDLRRPRVAMHLVQLQLSLGAHALGQGGVTDDVAEGLSVAGKR